MLSIENKSVLRHLETFYQLLLDYKHQKQNYFGYFKPYIVQYIAADDCSKFE